MQLPALEILPGETVFQVSRRLEVECRDRGIALSGFETLNTSLPISRFANFFQAWSDGQETVIVVMTGEWTGEVLMKILNILLEIRADPDPPGAKLRFRFFSAHPVPAILDTMFGDYRLGPVECRAAMVTSFGFNLRPEACPRLAAVGLQLLGMLGLRTGFTEERGIRRLAEFVIQEVRGPAFPPDGAPLNTMICTGCLYGEMLRSRLPWWTEWTMVKEYQPWPCIIVRQAADAARGNGRRTLGFSPIAMVILLSQEGGIELLEKQAENLADRCRAEFRGVDS
jgi:hypothetical protein